MRFSSLRGSPISARRILTVPLKILHPRIDLRRSGQRRSEHEGPSVIVVHIRLVGRAAAVNVVQIELRRAEVLQRVGVVLFLQATGRIERQVVSDELPEIRKGGGDRTFL